MKVSKLVFLVCLAALFFSACGAVGGVRRNPDGGIDFTVNLTEADMANVIGQALSQAQLSLTNTTVDFQAGQMVVSGTYSRPEGGSVNGNLTVTASMANGSAQVQVTDVNIEGFQADQARIDQINQRIADALTQRGNRENQRVSLTAISITDSAMVLTFNARQ